MNYKKDSYGKIYAKSVYRGFCKRFLYGVYMGVYSSFGSNFRLASSSLRRYKAPLLLPASLIRPMRLRTTASSSTCSWTNHWKKLCVAKSASSRDALTIWWIWWVTNCSCSRAFLKISSRVPNLVSGASICPMVILPSTWCR